MARLSCAEEELGCQPDPTRLRCAIAGDPTFTTIVRGRARDELCGRWQRRREALAVVLSAVANRASDPWAALRGLQINEAPAQFPSDEARAAASVALGRIRWLLGGYSHPFMRGSVPAVRSSDELVRARFRAGTLSEDTGRSHMAILLGNVPVGTRLFFDEHRASIEQPDPAEAIARLMVSLAANYAGAVGLAAPIAGIPVPQVAGGQGTMSVADDHCVEATDGGDPLPTAALAAIGLSDELAVLPDPPPISREPGATLDRLRANRLRLHTSTSTDQNPCFERLRRYEGARMVRTLHDLMGDSRVRADGDLGVAAGVESRAYWLTDIQSAQAVTVLVCQGDRCIESGDDANVRNRIEIRRPVRGGFFAGFGFSFAGRDRGIGFEQVGGTVGPDQIFEVRRTGPSIVGALTVHAGGYLGTGPIDVGLAIGIAVAAEGAQPLRFFSVGVPLRFPAFSDFIWLMPFFSATIDDRPTDYGEGARLSVPFAMDGTVRAPQVPTSVEPHFGGGIAIIIDLGLTGGIMDELGKLFGGGS
jgi:hypothetical protein